MAGEKFIKDVAGQLTEIVTKQTGGVGSEEKIISTDASGRIDSSFMPTGIGTDTYSLVASEALSQGDYVNIWNDGVVAKIRKAIAEDLKIADGFVLDNFALNDTALAYKEGQNAFANKEGGGALTIATRYFLSDTTAGTVTATSPTATGKHSQRLGKSTSTASISTEISKDTILRA